MSTDAVPLERLEQDYGELIAERLAQAELIISSDLTLIECDRVLLRAVTLNELEESDAAHRQARFNAVAARWTLLSLDEEIVERARRRFPAEPIRAVDAIHLASAVVARKAVPDLAVLTLDRRVRTAADVFGFSLLPTDAELGL